MRKNVDERIQELEQQKARVADRLNRLRTQKKVAARRADTRRKIIAGAFALKHCERDPEFAEKLMWLLNRELVRDEDRALFDLPPLPNEPPADGGATV